MLVEVWVVKILVALVAEVAVPVKEPLMVAKVALPLASTDQLSSVMETPVDWGDPMVMVFWVLELPMLMMSALVPPLPMLMMSVAVPVPRLMVLEMLEVKRLAVPEPAPAGRSRVMASELSVVVMLK